MQQPGDSPDRNARSPLWNSSSSAVLTGDPFVTAIAGIDDTTDLARPALALAADEYPGLNVRKYLNQLDDLADEALQNVVIGARSECDAAKRLACFLTDTKGFHGNEAAYYDPRNSLFSDVLDLRTGIPITLSLLLIEVGRRLGLPLVGIGFPGHFLVGCGAHKRNEYLLLDMFSGGKVVDWDECVHRTQALGLQFQPEIHLAPVTNREFLNRMLRNLQAVYVRRRDAERAQRTIARLTLLDASHASGYTQLAVMLSSEGNHAAARRCLRAYLDIESSGDSAEAARELLSELLDQRAKRN